MKSLRWRSLVFVCLVHHYSIQSSRWYVVRALSSSAASSSSSSSMKPNNNNHHDNNDNTDNVGWKATPCNRICRYNSNVYDGLVCIGCFRDTYEISHWDTMTPQEKSYTLDDAADRLVEQLQQQQQQLPSSSSTSTMDTKTNDIDGGRLWYGSVSEAELRQQATQWRTLDGQ